MHPVSGNQEAGRARKHQVEHDVAVAEDKEVDVGMRPEIFLCKKDHVFVILSLVFGCFACLMLLQSAFAAAERPAEGKAECPPGMDACIQPLAEFIAEKGADKAESLTAIIDLVAMSEKETFA